MKAREQRMGRTIAMLNIARRVERTRKRSERAGRYRTMEGRLRTVRIVPMTR